MPNVQNWEAALNALPKISQEKAKLFFKTEPGTYGHHDRFLGLTVPQLRRVAKGFQDLSFADLTQAMTSPFNEARLFALLIVVDRYRTDPTSRDAIYDFYMTHKAHVNNWNLVDASAHWIVGAHLWTRDTSTLDALILSPLLWDRRIALVATWFFIKQGACTKTFELTQKVLDDREDLIHKAAGWMLREAGKSDLPGLLAFLDSHVEHMPRTMVRYALERVPKADRDRLMAVPQKKA